MSTDEQRVRTMCGWIGVEISKSRKRRADDPEHGLYRVRGTRLPAYPTFIGQDAMEPVPSEWTAYAFTLERIESEIVSSIERGVPAGPIDLVLPKPSPRFPEPACWTIPTRWTQAYRGRRDLGVQEPVVIAQLKPEAAHRVMALAALVDEGLVEMRHTQDGCMCEGTAKLTMACVDVMMRNPDARGRIRERQAQLMRTEGTPRQRQRQDNAEFHAEHLERREYGLRARHATKLRRNEGERAPHFNSPGLTGASAHPSDPQTGTDDLSGLAG